MKDTPIPGYENIVLAPGLVEKMKYVAPVRPNADQIMSDSDKQAFLSKAGLKSDLRGEVQTLYPGTLESAAAIGCIFGDLSYTPEVICLCPDSRERSTISVETKGPVPGRLALVIFYGRNPGLPCPIICSSGGQGETRQLLPGVRGDQIPFTVSALALRPPDSPDRTYAANYLEVKFQLPVFGPEFPPGWQADYGLYVTRITFQFIQ